jgi:hypothetical protein
MTLKTPEKRRHDALSGTAPSPLVSKRRRTSTHQLLYSDSEQTRDMDTRYLPQVTGFDAPQLPELDLDTLIPLSHADSSAAADESELPPFPIKPLSEKNPNIALTAAVREAGTSDSARAAYIIDQETHSARLAIQADVRSEKGTDPSYARHLKNYELFTVHDQARRLEKDLTWQVMNPHPITAGKAALFLGYETTRPKVPIYIMA